MVVFKNEKLFADNVYLPDVTEEDIESTIPPATFSYISSKPKFSIDFPKQPEETKGETSSGGYKLTLKYAPNKDLVYMVMVSEISSKIKPSKYEKTAADMANKFAEKTEAKDPETSTFTVDGFNGTQKTYTKGVVFYRYVSICIDGFAYQLIYLNSSEDGETGEDFFQSFSVK